MTKMILKTGLALAMLTAFAGCALTSADVSRNPAQAPMPPTSSAEIVTAAPAGAPSLGTVDVQANNYADPSDCTKRLLSEAAKLGGDSVVVTYQNGGVSGRGPRCKGDVYHASK